jgi:hypothetical protein
MIGNTTTTATTTTTTTTTNNNNNNNNNNQEEIYRILDRCFKLVLGFAKATPKSVAMLECDKYS